MTRGCSTGSRSWPMRSSPGSWQDGWREPGPPQMPCTPGLIITNIIRYIPTWQQMLAPLVGPLFRSRIKTTRARCRNDLLCGGAPGGGRNQRPLLRGLRCGNARGGHGRRRARGAAVGGVGETHAVLVAMNTSDQLITDTLRRVKTIAVVGASNKPHRASYGVMRFLQSRGYRCIPVNPALAGQMLLGETVYPDLKSIGQAVDMVDVFRNSADCRPGGRRGDHHRRQSGVDAARRNQRRGSRAGLCGGAHRDHGPVPGNRDTAARVGLAMVAGRRSAGVSIPDWYPPLTATGLRPRTAGCFPGPGGPRARRPGQKSRRRAA